MVINALKDDGGDNVEIEDWKNLGYSYVTYRKIGLDGFLNLEIAKTFTIQAHDIEYIGALPTEYCPKKSEAFGVVCALNKLNSGEYAILPLEIWNTGDIVINNGTEKSLTIVMTEGIFRYSLV